MGTKTVFRLGELFCGPGGIALGAKKARIKKDDSEYCFKGIWANDYHEETCSTYQHNFPETKVICEDVRKLKIETLEPIDAFAYGFPCNDFSNVGEKKGFDGEFGPLYSYGVQVLNKFNPKVFMAENVGGLASANEGKAFIRILRDLEKAGKHGYKLSVHKYKFEEYGIPQTRHRIIIIGFRKDLDLEFKIPAPTHTQKKYTSAKYALMSPPIPNDAHNNELTNQSSTVVERLKLIKPGQNIWQTDLPEHLQLKVKGAKLSQIYKRLHPDEPSYTITGSGGGGTHVYHWEEPRALTNRERARIQTFPDNHIFIGKKESVRRQIGMAVSPKMAEILFESILKTFAGINYDSIDANLNFSLNLNEKQMNKNVVSELAN
ncbi:MAG: DNA cytosine methyltransferase [Campylobacterales bacterium]|nr:DNA cytosine methyltransferase [Campylobacterales bacterium]MBD3823316.1 DNA cytosine methyltransferase [Campylobacterota bacterium]MBD3841578.1 DNA cytosine methyltransferase [Campylobacterales bacterium]